jgi:hypothetical protein
MPSIAGKTRNRDRKKEVTLKKEKEIRSKG